MSSQPPALPDFIADDEMPDFISDEAMQAVGGEAAPAEEYSPSVMDLTAGGPSAMRTKPDVPSRGEALEELADLLPAAGAAVGGIAGGGAGAIPGAAIGESVRQLGRVAAGLPQAPGITQSVLGMDPDSPDAAIAGFAGESLAGSAGALSSKLLNALADASSKSALRSIVRNLLGGARNPMQAEEAVKLARRAQAEGITSPLGGMSMESRLARAKAAKEAANSESEFLTHEAIARGETVESLPVLEAIERASPSPLPGGRTARVTAAETKAAGKAWSDTADALFSGPMHGPTGTAVPVERMVGEIDRLNDVLETMYERGALKPAKGLKTSKAAVEAARAELRKVVPEVADARLRQHELITITNMIDDAIKSGFLRGGGQRMELAGGAGAAAVGRFGPLASGIAGKVALAAAPLTVPARQLAAKILSGGADTAQLWMRVADLYGWRDLDSDPGKEAERNRKAQDALRGAAEGIITP